MTGWASRAGRALAFLALGLVPALPAQRPPVPRPQPRLVVVIVVDQFRGDYLDRFRPFFGRGGFNLLLERGAHFVQARHQHASTSTCPGYAVVLTGSHGNVNGIIANSWFNSRTGRQEYCAADTTASLIGAAGAGRSPRNLKDATVGDLLAMATGGASRAVAVAPKDRSAIMLGGHLAAGVYWMMDTLFVTSTYYRPDLPSWVAEFNRSHAVTSAFGKQWERLLPAAAYELVGPDDVAAETGQAGMGRTFPHVIGRGATPGPEFAQAFDRSPFSNDVVADFAMRAVAAEGLGRDSVPDLLAIGFSANDLVGHGYGPDSHEVMDITLRLDRTLSRLFGYLDRTVGLASTVMVLTSDHGISPLPELFQRLHPGTSSRRIHPDLIASAASTALEARYGRPGAAGWLAHHDFPQIHLNLALLREKRIALEDAERVVAEAVARVPGVHEALTATELARQRRQGVRNGSVYSFHPERSGNVYYQMEPYVAVAGGSTGADHGSRWAYDQHVPVLWYGGGIRPGVYREPVAVADIAPTLAAMLGLTPPGGAQGRVLAEMFRR